MGDPIQYYTLEIIAQRLAGRWDQPHLTGTHRDCRIRSPQKVVNLGNVWAQPAHLGVAGNQFAALQRRADRIPAIYDQHVGPTFSDVASGGTARRTASYHYGVPVGAGRLHGLSSGAIRRFYLTRTSCRVLRS